MAREIDLDRLERAFALDRDLRAEVEVLIRAFDESALHAFLGALAGAGPGAGVERRRHGGGALMEAASVARGGAPSGIDVGALERTSRSSLRRVGGRALSHEDHEELVQEGWVAYYTALERGTEV